MKAKALGVCVGLFVMHVVCVPAHAAVVPRTHVPTWGYVGCTGRFIQLPNQGPSLTQANWNYIETTDTEVQQNAACNPSNTKSCPSTQTSCVPVFYFDPHKDYGGSCNNGTFRANHPNEDGWNHSSALVGTSNPVLSSNRIVWAAACGGAQTMWIPNFGDIPQLCGITSGSAPASCGANPTLQNTGSYNGATCNLGGGGGCYFTSPTNASYFLQYLSNSQDYVSTNDTFFEDDTNYHLSDTLLNTGASSTLEIANDAALITQEAYLNDKLYPKSLYMNYFGCEGFGGANLIVTPTSLFATETKTNDKMAVAENCISDTNGTDKDAGFDPVINAASVIFNNYLEKTNYFVQHWGSAGENGGRREAVAALWLTMAAERLPYFNGTPWHVAQDPTVLDLAVLWEDWNGGGVTTTDIDQYPEEYIWPDPTTAVVGGANQSMRAFVQNNMLAPGSGCPNKGTPTAGLGGISDALIPGTCALGSNNSPVGVYAVEFGACWWKGQTNMGFCGAIWNQTNNAVSIAQGQLYYGSQYTHKITWTGLETQFALAGSFTCTNCNATISLPCVVGDSGVTAPTAVSFPISVPAHDVVLVVQ